MPHEAAAASKSAQPPPDDMTRVLVSVAVAVLDSWRWASCSNANRTEGRESMRMEGTRTEGTPSLGGPNKIREPTQDVPRVCLCRPARKIRRPKIRRERNPCSVVSAPALWSGRMNGCIGDAGPVDGTEIAGSGKQESKQNADRQHRRRSCPAWKTNRLCQKCRVCYIDN